LFCQAVVYLLVALPAVAQSQAFATITIKATRSADPRNARVQVLPNDDLIASAVPLITLLRYAYDVPVNPSPRLSTLPDWTVREKYDIEAKALNNAILQVFRTAKCEADFSKLSADCSPSVSAS
jgi:uncharacterized protein (TIGR03435 family)